MINFRFINRAGRYMWTHPALVDPARDIDCTDMSDEQFESFVRFYDSVSRPNAAAAPARQH